MKIRTLFGIFASTAVLLTHALAQVPFTNSLVAYFPFNGSGEDASGNGNNGTLFGSAGFGVDRFGNSNSCLSLPGTMGVGSGVDIPSFYSMAYEPVTYSSWFLLKDYPYFINENAVMTLLGREQCGVQAQGAICVYSGNAETNFLIYYFGSSGYITQLVPPTNQWCQLVLTIDQSGQPIFYFNGTNVPHYGPSAPAAPPLDFRIGASASGMCGGNNRYVWNGLIDDVRIYNRALSASEVQQLYAYESAPISTTGQPPPVVGQPQPMLITRHQIVAFIAGLLVGLLTGLITGLLLGYCIRWLQTNQSKGRA